VLSSDRGATVLPPPASTRTSDLIEDFNSRGKVALVFFAAYFLGWDILAVMFWGPRMGLLAVVNLIMATLSIAAYIVEQPRARSLLHVIMATLSIAAYIVEQPRARSLLHGALIVLTIFGMIGVWATPSLDW
jgi:hypothetical protein